jgi:Ca2+-binding RTX toxin-like protein
MPYTITSRSPSEAFSTDQMNKVNGLISVMSYDASMNSVLSLVGDFTVYSFDGTAMPVDNDGNRFNHSTRQLMIDVNSMNGGLFDSYGSTALFRPIERTLFHELVHGAATGTPFSNAPSYGGVVVSYPVMHEQVAIFAENAIFNQRYWNYTLDDHPGERYGHGRAPTTTHGGGESASGTQAFTWVNSSLGVIFGRVADGVTFSITSNDAANTVVKTYWAASSSRAGGIENYATVSLDSSAGIFQSGSTKHLTNGADNVSATLMGADGALLAISMADSAIADVIDHGITLSAGLNQSRLLGISSEHFFDGKDANRVSTVGVGYNINGTIGSPSKISVSAEGTSVGTVIIGAGGYDMSISSKDRLLGSSGNDFIFSSSASTGFNELYGNAGDDVIIGSSGSDRIFGGSGNDVIAAGSGLDIVDGGSGIDVISFASSSGPIQYDNSAISHVSGSVSISGVEHVLGSKAVDTFRGGSSDSSMFLHGADGADIFYVGGSERFMGEAGTDRVALSDGTDWTVDLANGTVGDNAFWGMDEFFGGSGDDKFLGGVNSRGDTVTAVIHAGDGDDRIEVGQGTNAYGDGGDDVIVFTDVHHGIVDGGSGSGYDTLDASRLTGIFVNLDKAAQTLSLASGAAFDVSSFEGFDLSNTRYSVNGTGASETMTGWVHDRSWKGEINGGGGSDTLIGGFGDVLRGGSGSDNIHLKSGDVGFGGSDSDNFYINTSLGGKYYIGDLTSSDSLIINGSRYTGQYKSVSHSQVNIGTVTESFVDEEGNEHSGVYNMTYYYQSAQLNSSFSHGSYAGRYIGQGYNYYSDDPSWAKTYSIPQLTNPSYSWQNGDSESFAWNKDSNVGMISLWDNGVRTDIVLGHMTSTGLSFGHDISEFAIPFINGLEIANMRFPYAGDSTGSGVMPSVSVNAILDGVGLPSDFWL